MREKTKEASMSRIKPMKKHRISRLCLNILASLKRGIFITTLPFLGMVSTHAINTQEREESGSTLSSRVVEKLSAPESPEYDGNEFYWKDIFVKSGDTVGSILYSLGEDGKSAQNYVYTNVIPQHLLKLQIDQTISVLANDNGRVVAIHFFNDNENGEKSLIAIEKMNGKWQASTEGLRAEPVETIKLVRVQSSVHNSLVQSSVPLEIQTSLKNIFADRFSLDDLKEGDSIRLIYESFFYQGQEIATGNILAAEITKDGVDYPAYYFADPENKLNGSYYDGTGVATGQGFDIMPVAGARISSPFGIRRHPISGNYRLHAGIDYAVVTGTPIHSPAAGKIIERGVKGGYGNAIVLEHENGLQTLYGHMSRFQEDLVVGQMIPAGVVIGYVGSTGMSTGPHLHYEVRMNGRPVDPATSVLPTVNTLESIQLFAYIKTSLNLNKKLDLLKYNFPEQNSTKATLTNQELTAVNLQGVYQVGKELAQENAVASVLDISISPLPANLPDMGLKSEDYSLGKMLTTEKGRAGKLSGTFKLTTH